MAIGADLLGVPTFGGLMLLAFLLIRRVPGDPFVSRAGERGIDPARHAEPGRARE